MQVLVGKEDLWIKITVILCGAQPHTCIQFSTWNIQSLLNLTETYSVDAQPSHWLAKGLW